MVPPRTQYFGSKDLMIFQIGKDKLLYVYIFFIIFRTQCISGA